MVDKTINALWKFLSAGLIFCQKIVWLGGVCGIYYLTNEFN